MKKLVIGIILIFLGMPIKAFPGPCWVVKVHDGDTFTIATSLGTVNIRLACVDAPELKQMGGKEARDFLKKLVLYRFVEIKPVGTSYGRVVAIIWSGDKCVNEELVRAGWAWVDTKFCRDAYLLGLMNTARRLKLGLWKQRKPVPPWEFRRSHLAKDKR